MKIYVDKQSFEISSRNVITGIVSLKIDKDIFFPERDWNDSVIIILIFWIEDIIEIRVKKLRTMKFYFFDGPFAFEFIEKQKLSYLQLFDNGKTVSRRHVNFNNFVNGFQRNLLKCCEEVIEEMDKRGWVTPETVKLKLLFKELSSYANPLLRVSNLWRASCQLSADASWKLAPCQPRDTLR